MIIYLKTQQEIEGFREAGRIAGEVLSILLSSVSIGITTSELNKIALNECEKRNVTPTFFGYQGFSAAICTSINHILVHGIPNDEYKLQQGDNITIDVGVTKNGFIGDTAETIIVGENPTELIFSCRYALAKAFNKAKAGNKLIDISKAIYDERSKFMIPQEYGGHGINKNELHAAPFIPNIPRLQNDFTLRPGMILAIEPMLIDNENSKTSVLSDGWSVLAQGMCAHCEHTVLITENEPEILTGRN
jgi:methionyl aminopeptidase